MPSLEPWRAQDRRPAQSSEAGMHRQPTPRPMPLVAKMDVNKRDGAYSPPHNRSPSCRFEYDTLAYAFHREISPHIDQQMARQVLDTAWLSNVPPTIPPPPPPR